MMRSLRMAIPLAVLVTVTIALVGGVGTADAKESSCVVKYVSAEHVYLDAGAAAGLSAGLQVRVVRGTETVALLEVMFTAETSASCKVVSGEAEILPGDVVVYDAVEEAELPAAMTPVETSRRTRPLVDRSQRPVARSGPRVTGSMALQWDHADETADRGLSNDFVSVPFRLRVANLIGGTEFRSRGSFRHISRSGYSGNTPDAEWRNRIREIALVRDDRRQDFHFALGRIHTRYTASAGSFDGLSLDRRIGESVRMGLFGGFTPQWGTMAFSSDAKLAGASFNYNRRTPDGRNLDVVMAGVGRYDLGRINREYLAMTTSWSDGDRISLLQAAEVDVNRGWRKTAGTGSVALTSVTLTGRYRMNRRLALNLGYDEREPVRTWESRSLPDSLFDNAGNTGWRAGANWRSDRRLSAGLSGSVRRRSGNGDSYSSYNGFVNLSRWTAAALDARLACRGFTGPHISGWSPSAALSRSIRYGLRVGMEGGYYRYADTVNDIPDRTNTWMNLTGSGDLGSHWSAALEYRRDWGDDIAGNRLFLEMRTRF